MGVEAGREGEGGVGEMLTLSVGNVDIRVVAIIGCYLKRQSNTIAQRLLPRKRVPRAFWRS
jgi:hypothetical protein